MDRDIMDKIYQDERMLDYLRYHPKWYYYLDQNPSNFVKFEKQVKEDLKITTYDKLEKARKQIDFASKLIEYFKNK